MLRNGWWHTLSSRILMLRSNNRAAGAAPRTRSQRRRLAARPGPLPFEILESRQLLCADALHDMAGALLGTAGTATIDSISIDPTSTDSVGAETAVAAPMASGISAAPLTAIPLLHSRPSATAKLYLDFDGDYTASWGSFSPGTTPAYDKDGDVTTFSDTELSNISNIFYRVSELFAPFHIDVTTENPGTFPDGVALHVVIGGDLTWLGSPAGGVAYVDSFTYPGQYGPNIVFVYDGGGNSYTASTIAHESGHAFGLLHQSTWSGSTKTNEYDPGNSLRSPIMGSGSGTRQMWWYGRDSDGAYQDDLAILSNNTNGFGYRTDDHGGTVGTATAATVSGAAISGSGVIETISDVDVFSFATPAGSASFTLSVNAYSPMLDSTLEIRNSGDVVVASANTTSLSESLTTTLSAGTYYVVVKSKGNYGDIGQYSFTATLPGSVSGPEVQVVVGSSTNVSDGGSVSFGSVTQGSSATKTFTVTNIGNLDLNLGTLSLPAGYSIVDDLVSTLAPSSSDTFTIALDTTTLGTYSGQISFTTNDSDEATFDILVSGTVALPTFSEIEVLSGSSTLLVTGSSTVDFGTATQGGTSLTQTFTVRNLGTATLTLGGITLPAGFSIGTNGLVSSLAPNASDTFTVVMPTTTLGTKSGQMSIANNDSDEAPFVVNLTGIVAAKAAPEVTVTDYNGNNVLDNTATFNLGTVIQGQTATSYVFTVTNTGTATLTLGTLSVPAGFSIVNGLVTSLAPNASDTFTIRLNSTGSGYKSGNVSFATNDTDENPFNFAVTGAVVAPPTNDSFSKRTVIKTSSTTVNGTNVNSTSEIGEPNHAGVGNGTTVWWTWSAPSNGVMTVRTTGTSIDTVLAVYTGTSVSALTPVVSNDDEEVGVLYSSLVTFNAVSGTKYQIAVDSYDGSATGTFPLNLSFAAAPAAPGGINASDGLFADRVRLTWNAALNATGYDIWRSTTNSSATAVKIFDSASTTVRMYDDTTAVPGTTYYYWVTAKNTAGGSSPFSASNPGYRALTGKFNDALANAVVIQGTEFTSSTVRNVTASKEFGEPSHAGVSAAHSVWWRWTASANGLVTLDTLASSFDTTLAVYTGTSVGGLTAIASNNDDLGGGTTQSLLSFTAVAGTTYQIAVDGASGATGDVVLHLSFVAAALSGSAGSVTDSSSNPHQVLDELFSDAVRRLHPPTLFS